MIQAYEVGISSRRRVTAPSSPPLPVLETSGRPQTLERRGPRERHRPRASLGQRSEPGGASRRRVTARSSLPVSMVQTSGRRPTLERRGPRSRETCKTGGPSHRQVMAPSSPPLPGLEVVNLDSSGRRRNMERLGIKRQLAQTGEVSRCRVTAPSSPLLSVVVETE